MVAGLPLSTDVYMVSREWDSFRTMSLSAYMGGLKRDGLSTDTILVTTIATGSHLLSP